MSARSDTTNFAQHFDFESMQVRIRDLIFHLRVLGMEPEGIGLQNAMACLAAADLLASHYDSDDMDEPGRLIRELREYDQDTWGEV